jgi:hypothetical protein
MANGQYGYQDSASPETQATSDSWLKNATQGYEQEIMPVRQQALRETMADLQSQGMEERLGQYSQGAINQRFDEDIARNKAAAGLQAANVGEQQRQILEQRGWQVEDRDYRLARLREEAARKREEQERGASGQLWGSILGGVGSVAGGVLGGAPGAMAGGALGGALGSYAGESF